MWYRLFSVGLFVLASMFHGIEAKADLCEKYKEHLWMFPDALQKASLGGVSLFTTRAEAKSAALSAGLPIKPETENGVSVRFGDLDPRRLRYQGKNGKYLKVSFTGKETHLIERIQQNGRYIRKPLGPADPYFFNDRVHGITYIQMFAPENAISQDAVISALKDRGWKAQHTRDGIELRLANPPCQSDEYDLSGYLRVAGLKKNPEAIVQIEVSVGTLDFRNCAGTLWLHDIEKRKERCPVPNGEKQISYTADKQPAADISKEKKKLGF